MKEEVPSVGGSMRAEGAASDEENRHEALQN